MIASLLLYNKISNDALPLTISSGYLQALASIHRKKERHFVFPFSKEVLDVINLSGQLQHFWMTHLQSLLLLPVLPVYYWQWTV